MTQKRQSGKIGMPEPTPEHPDDRKMREESEAYARERGSEFAARYRTEFEALVLTYADDEARERLEALREVFWSQDWLKPTRAREPR